MGVTVDEAREQDLPAAVVDLVEPVLFLQILCLTDVDYEAPAQDDGGGLLDPTMVSDDVIGITLDYFENEVFEIVKHQLVWSLQTLSRILG